MAVPQTVIDQSKPAATTRTDLYSPGAGRRARVNVTASAQTATDDVQISLARSGAVHATSQVLAFDLAVLQDVPFQIEMYLEGTDVVRVYSTGGNVAFTVNGYEDDIPSA
jgi:hypothetical protein